MKRTAALLLVALLWGCTANTPQEEEHYRTILSKLADHNSSYVAVASHRADWRNFPENSLAGIESAIGMGVDIIELDVRMTADGVPVLMHDATLDRTTTGKGRVADWTLDSIRTLYLRNGCAIKTKHRVPTLREAMLAAKGRVLVNLDKSYDIFDHIYPVLVETGTIDHVILKGKLPYARVSEEMAAYGEGVLYMPIVNLNREDASKLIDQWLEVSPPVAFELLFESDENPLPKQMPGRLSGKSLIWYNTLWDTMAGGHDDDRSLDDPADGYGFLIDSLGARIIQTDRPAYLINYLQSRSLRN